MIRYKDFELRLTSIWVPLLWTALLVIAFCAESITNYQFAIKIAKVEAVSSFEKDVLFRKWAAGHGGVYAPISIETTPNPYLSHVAERDITTPGGKELTLVNPAYMTRQVHELGEKQYRHKGSIASRRPLNPANQADEWESNALEMFESGTKNFGELNDIDGLPYFRYMEPLLIEDSCLKCHADQGYEVGDLHGGISVSVPMQPIFAETNRHTYNTGAIIFFVWLAGLLWLRISTINIHKSAAERKLSSLTMEQNLARLSISEKALRESEARYRNFVESASEGIYRVDFTTPIPIEMADQEIEEAISKNALVGEVNETLAQMYGLKPEEMINRKATDFAPDYGKRALLAVRATGHQVKYLETTDVDSSGDELFLSESLGAIIEKGMLLRIWGMQRDITERKKAEKALFDLQKKSSAYLENSPVCTKIVDLDFKLQYMSSAGVKELGIEDINNFYGKPYPLSFYPESFKEKMNNSLVRAKATGEVVTQEASTVDVGGNTLWFQSTIIPVNDALGQIEYLMVVSMETTERRLAEEETIRLEKQLRQTQKLEAIGTLAGGIAHDFNNLLFAILGNASLAGESLPEDSPVRENIEEINTAGLRAAELVNQILTFARRGEKQASPLDVMLIVKEVTKLLRATLPTTIGINLRLDTKNTTIVADPTEIHQVVMNLCTNASQAMMQHGGRLEIGLSEITFSDSDLGQIRGVKEGTYLILTISDTGVGISKEDQERIFEPFYTTKKAGQGTGMGLAVVHGIVKDLNGFINVYSEVGEGTTFNVYLPLTITERSLEELDLGVTPEGTERVLVVDDESFLTKMTKGILEGLGYTVETAKDGKTALAMFNESGGFDVVITDQTMPNMTGAELAEKIYQTHPQQPIILCTGFSHVIPREKARDLGISAYLSKPVSKQNLGRTIRQVLDRDISGGQI